MKLLLKNGQPRLGDTLMITPAVRDLKHSYPDYQIKVQTSHMQIWQNNPHLSEYEGMPDKIVGIGPGEVTQGSATNGLHFTNAFRISLEEKLGIAIRQGPLKPELFLSKYEKEQRTIEGDYWVINIDCGPYDTKRWIPERWQQLVNSMPYINFVQIGSRQYNSQRLSGNNVIDMVGKTENYDTGLRELFSLIYHSQGVISLVSASMHIAGALEKPCVVIAGAREPSMHIAGALEKPCVVIAGAREPVTFEAYQWHRYLHNIGSLPCAKLKTCWSGGMGACRKKAGRHGIEIKDVAKCIDMITVQDVEKAVGSHYEGKLFHEPKAKAKPIEPKIMKIVTNARILGGAERSVIEIAKMAQERGYKVQIVPRGGNVCQAFQSQLQNVEYTSVITDPCDVLLLYASDMVFDFHKEEFNPFNNLQV
jgi:ADP-heptose:LPS heptosyltransferase